MSHQNFGDDDVAGVRRDSAHRRPPTVDEQLLNTQWKKQVPLWVTDDFKQQYKKKKRGTHLSSSPGGSKIAFDPELRSGMTEYLRDPKVIDSRPTTLQNWTFDDVVVTEVPSPWWEQICRNTAEHGEDPNQTAGQDSSGNTLLEGTDDLQVCCYFQGLSQSQVGEAVARELQVRRGQVLFMTPMPFLSSSKHTLLLRGLTRSQRQRVVNELGTLTVNSKIVFFDAPTSAKLVSPFHTGTIDSLPDLKYEYILRNGSGNLLDVLTAAKDVRENGFINYTNICRHGSFLAHSFLFGKNLMHQEYANAVGVHLSRLTEGIPEVNRAVQTFLRVVRDVASLSVDRDSVEMKKRIKVHGKEWQFAADAVSEAISNNKKVLLANETGLYPPHLIAINQFLNIGMHKRGDTSQLIREGIARHVLMERLVAVADVHWNRMASRRMELHGKRVVVGDLVVPRANRQQRWDSDEYNVDTMPTGDVQVQAIWGRGFPELERDGGRAMACIKVIETEAEAEQYSLEDVVLPKLGSMRGWPQVEASEGEAREQHLKNIEEALCYPKCRGCDAAAYHKLTTELMKVNGLKAMKMGPLPTYRRLVVKPREFKVKCWNDKRKFEFGDNDLDEKTYLDTELVRRQKSPVLKFREPTKPGRHGITDPDARREFVRPTRDGITTAMEFVLPRGSQPTSLLREMFTVANIDKKDVPGLVVPRPLEEAAKRGAMKKLRRPRGR